ncbi:uncharacterized protein LOC124253634 [Haliotis rubra]|uniref:uncharacterized protein LOC124253634 n=1 Tax=Haliotis rubra TaxID=36100 RepID=UPI001EE62EF5|nr:uncharacterized protein LOC124253634 [Haliotis rubra]
MFLKTKLQYLRRIAIVLKNQTNSCRRSITSSGVLLKHDESHEHPISRFPVPDVKELPEDLREKFGKSKFLPNVFGALSYRPDELRAFINYHEVLMRDSSNLTKADKEMIAVVVSADNQCLYCVATHSALYRLHSRNPVLADQLSTNWRMADLDIRQKAILDFATTVAECHSPADEQFERLYENGMNHDDAWDIGSLASFLSMSNRLAHFLRVRPNPEFYLIGRIPAAEKKDK